MRKIAKFHIFAQNHILAPKVRYGSFFCIFSAKNAKMQEMQFGAQILVFPFRGSRMTKIPLRLPAFLHGAAKSQNYAQIN